MYIADSLRYGKMQYNRCGGSGLRLPALSLGLWHNFGGTTVYENSRAMLRRAFDLGVTHFDLANNYGPPPGAAEENFGRILRQDFLPYRDELIISTKAGHLMWDGPYGDGGSRKYLFASLEQSLKRMGLEYVDIFYHHVPDSETPVEETLTALADIVRQGKALYAGISKYYTPAQAQEAFGILQRLGTPCLIHQVKYNMFDRRIENGLLDANAESGVGCITFSPLNRGVLTDKYLDGIPADSRAAGESPFLKPDQITDDVVEKVTRLNELALRRGQTLAQMAVAWNYRHDTVTSVLIGASKVRQIEECAAAFDNQNFSDEELAEIDRIVGGS